MGAYSASPIKRKRRSQEESFHFIGAIAEVLDEYKGEAITIRHLFYRLVSRGVLDKDERSYDLLCSHLSKWRISGVIEFNRFVDGTRWHHGERIRRCLRGARYRSNSVPKESLEGPEILRRGLV
jgi:hypothetical protein